MAWKDTSGGGTADMSQYDINSNNILDKIEGIRQYTAGESINAFQVVAVTTANTVVTANSNDIAHANKVIGLALETKTSGAAIKIHYFGSVANPAWSLITGKTYFLSGTGSISDVPPTSGFVQKIGVAENPTTLFLQLGEPTIL